MSRIRLALAEDFDAVDHLSQGFGYPQQSGDAALVGFKSILKSDSDCIWIFTEQDQVLGWIHLFTALRLASPRFIEIGGLVVSADHRQRGVGRKLIEWAASWSREQNMSLRVRCDSKREQTCQFYRATGFSELKTQTVFETDFSVKVAS